MTLTPALVAVISYGHNPSLIATALSPAIALASRGMPVTPLVIDDKSGRPPNIANGTETVETRTNAGYAAAVNFACELAEERGAHRLVLINPDAQIDAATLAEIIDDLAPVTVPAIPCGEVLENVRTLMSPAQVLRQLIAGRLGAQRCHPQIMERIELPLGAPWAPAGTVMAFDLAALKSRPLRPEMFWLEMSAWARENGDLWFAVLPSTGEHAGGSTRGHASTKVAMSLLTAQIAYIRGYGRWLDRALIPVAIVAGQALRFATGRAARGEFRNAISVYRGTKSWQEVE